MVLHSGFSMRGNFQEGGDEGYATMGVYGAGGLDIWLSRSLSLFAEGEWSKYTNRGYLNLKYINPPFELNTIRIGLSFYFFSRPE